MKITFILLASCFIFFSCQSNEEKARELVKNEINQRLANMESYESVEFRCDSLLNNEYLDSIIINLAKECNTLINKRNRFRSEQREWDKKYFEYRDKEQAVFQHIAKDCKKESRIRFDSMMVCTKNLNVMKLKIQEQSSKIKRDFIGYSIYNKFRFKNLNGQFDFESIVLYANKDLDKIIYVQDYNLEKIIDSAMKYNEKDSIIIVDF